MSDKILATIELSGIEKTFCLHGSWVIICHAAHLSGDQSIIVKNISSAISHLLKRHPRMRSRVQVNDNRPVLEVLDYDEQYFNPDLFYSIRKAKDQPWEKIAEEESYRNPYSNQGQTMFPLFHFLLLLNENSSSSNEDLFHLLLFSNHCAADGRSGFILINDFLTLATSRDLDNHVEPVNQQIIPCLDELIPRSTGCFNPLSSWMAKRAFRREARQLQHPRIPVKTMLVDEAKSNSFPPLPVKHHFVIASTSNTLYSRLREKCQAEHVTLHGPLFACLMLAIHQYFPEKKNKKKKKNQYLNPWGIDVDYNMRPRLPQSPLTPSTVGFCVCICPIKLQKRLSLASTRFWTLAEKCAAITNNALNSGEVFFSEHFFSAAVENEEVFNKLFRNFPDGRVSEMNFSNIGKYPYSCDYGEGQLRLRGLHVVGNGGIYHPSAAVLITCAGDGQLDIGFIHEMEDEERARQFLDYYIQLVEKCADAPMDTTLQHLLSDDLA